MWTGRHRSTLTFIRSPNMFRALLIAGRLILTTGAFPADGAAEPVQNLIKDLANDNFERRADAEKKLLWLGAHALPLLEKELENKDIEVQRLARRLVARI